MKRLVNFLVKKNAKPDDVKINLDDIITKFDEIFAINQQLGVSSEDGSFSNSIAAITKSI